MQDLVYSDARRGPQVRFTASCKARGTGIGFGAPTSRNVMAKAEIQLDNFSRSVAGLGSLVDEDGTTLGQIAEALIRTHTQYGLAPVLARLETTGTMLTLAEWLERVEGLFDLEAVRRSPSEVVDGRLTLLALARLDPDFDAVLRAAKVRWRLERDLGYPLEDILWPWALPVRPTQLLELWSEAMTRTTPAPVGAHFIAVRGCAFAPDARLLAAGDEEGAVVLWHGATGERHAVLTAHIGRIDHIRFSRDGRLVATSAADGLRVWDVEARRERLSVLVDGGPPLRCAFSPDGTSIAIATFGGTVRRVDLASGRDVGFGVENAPLPGVLVNDFAFSRDGRRLATAGPDGALGSWDVASGAGGPLWRGSDALTHVALSTDGARVATVAESGMVVLIEAAPRVATELPGHRGHINAIAFSPDGRLIATCGSDRYTRIWDVASATELRVLKGGEAVACAWRPDGRALATAHREGDAHLWDVASGRQLHALEHGAAVNDIVVAPDGGLLATACDDGRVRVFEEVERPGLLPAVVPDTVGDVDLLGVEADADALANVIAARETSPPLSIGLFGDWGSGKSFLIGQVKERVRRLSLRSRRAGDSAYCRYVRNVEFNAWHYADANLWASLVTHIFDELAKPDRAAGVTDEETARAQLARLEEQLAASSALRERAERAHRQVASVAARRRLLRWMTWGLVGVNERALGELRDELGSVRGTLRLVLPTRRSRALVAAGALVVAALGVALVALAGAGGLGQAITAVGAALTSVAGWIALARSRLRVLLDRAGERVRAEELHAAALDAELAAARDAEAELARELADLASGRRVARFASERDAAEDYRAQLGLVSRIHDDFVIMSDILRAQAEAREREHGEPGDEDLPPIDRIVLYIDDLDRCPPKRVVEVLQAVHLILAVPLFVVVIAVDPNWLLQSLRLHYAELLAADAAADDEEAWHSGPLDYLEKIIQMPFALRPMNPDSVRSLVHGLLPVEQPAAETYDGARDASAGAAAPADSAAATTTGASAAAPAPPPPPSRRPAAPRATPSLSPRSLALSKAERDFAVEVARVLPTPRSVKKFTNLYRLLRAGLDEHGGQLDRLLADDGADAPEYSAVLILLAAIIRFPEESSDALLCLGDLRPDAAPDRRPWSGYVEELRARGERFDEVAAFFDAIAPTSANGEPPSWTREPFRRWALEVSRYSFATGQEVFARTVGGAPARDAPAG